MACALIFCYNVGYYERQMSDLCYKLLAKLSAILKTLQPVASQCHGFNKGKW